MTAKPVTMWACVGSRGNIHPDTVKPHRALSVAAFCGDSEYPWAWWRRHHGWRCVKVTVREFTDA